MDRPYRRHSVLARILDCESVGDGDKAFLQRLRRTIQSFNRRHVSEAKIKNEPQQAMGTGDVVDRSPKP